MYLYRAFLPHVSLAIILTATAPACASRNPSAPAAGGLRTDRSEYVITRSDRLIEVTIGLTYLNNTGAPVYVPICRAPYPPDLEKHVNEHWLNAYSPGVLRCLERPLSIEAGATYRFTYRVAGGLPGSNIGPKFKVQPIAGTYRAVWGLYSKRLPDGSVTDLLPLAARVSNTFELRE